MRRAGTRFGCRGGEGPTAGMTATTYRFSFPDGSEGRKRTFLHGGGDEARAFVYQHDGKWHVAGVRALDDYAGRTLLEHLIEVPAYRLERAVA